MKDVRLGQVGTLQWRQISEYGIERSNYLIIPSRPRWEILVVFLI